MLFNDLSTALVLFSISVVILAALCVFYVVRLGAYCRDAVEFVRNQNKKSVTLRRMAEVETSLTELTDAYDAMMTSHKKLRARINMRAVRDDKKNDAKSGNGVDKDALRLAAKERGLI